MKNGKVSESILKRSVLKYTTIKKEYLREDRQSLLVHGAAVGADCAVFSWEKDTFVLSAQASGTFRAPGQITFAMNRAANSIAARGGIPESAMLHIMLPQALREAKLKMIMEEAHETAKDLQITIAGGHTEVTEAVLYPIVSVTMLGSAKKLVTPAAKPGEDIIMTKWAGMAGTLQLIKRFEGQLVNRFAPGFLQKTDLFKQMLQVIPEAATAVKSDVSAMHDVAEGGVFGALWELAESSGVGLTIELKKIPIRQETVEICNFLDINPYELMGTGSLLMTCDNGHELVRLLSEEGIFAAVIGKVTDSNDRIIVNDEETRFLEPSRNEELFREF